ncbi:adenylate/guanylate cyclase domain-containing protein [Dactylosporangium sp. NPDC048998]|uniref:adenylate/guanylate cyclase domain-containing protein n=1 Tax=Dactylosporangium sp. NPDC048998 TaxID=3363976 RepID=UPI00372390A4
MSAISSQCARCGRPASEGDRFCGGCGAELSPPCPTCGRTLAPDAVFCTGCGTPRADTSVARNLIRAERTAGRASVPAIPAARSEDRRRISVLFVDLIDFTPYVERADPELVRELQKSFFSTAREVIGQYGGVVEKYIGDAVMALFGAPVATETDAVRCVRAGLELQRVLARYASTGEGERELRFRVGVATGEALVDVAAARDGGQAIVAGDVVNTASRLQSLAPPGGVLVCGSTYALTKSSIRYEAQPPATLRGRSTPTEVWLALAPLRRNHPDREAGSTPLVNRTHELSLLVNALHRGLRERTPQLVTVLGHAGIGKSRLVHELFLHAERLFDAPVAWRTGRCPPFGENVTYAALADIVKAQSGILDTDTAETTRERLDTALAAIVGPSEAERLAEALSPLVGLPGPKLAPDETESAWRRFVVALAAHRPTVLVFEDLHWADESMVRFVERLGASVRDVPLLLLCTARPELLERNPSWAGAVAGAVSITLPPLRDTEIATMYAHLLGAATFPSQSLSSLVELADGNPLYALEYTRMLAEQGNLPTTDAFGRKLPMPDSVHAVIANRVDLLDAADRAVLQAAAVVGMNFWPGAVGAAMSRPADGIERSLRRLEQRDLIHEQAASTMEGQTEYRFGHVLVRDVCYQRLPRTERVARHELTAEWLDNVAADRDTDLAEVVANHRFTAYEIARSLGLDAARYSVPARDAMHRAARRAYALHALEAAAAHAGKALALCDEDTDALERLRIEQLSTEIAFYANPESFLGTGGADRLVGLAERLYAAGDQAGAARAWTVRGQAAWLRADRLDALSCLDRAVELFDELPDGPQKADAYAELGRLHMLNFEVEPAVAAASAAAEIADRLGLIEVATGARITIGTALFQAGDRSGLVELQSALEVSRERRLLSEHRALRNVSWALLEDGDWTASAALLGDSRNAVPGSHTLATGYSDVAQSAYFTGDWPAYVVAAEAAMAEPGAEWDLQVRGVRAWIRTLRGQALDDGGNDVEDLVAAGRRSGFYRLQWVALGHGALCRALQGRDRDAEALIVELAKTWREVRAIASGEWIDATAHAAVLSGRVAMMAVRDMLADVPHRTPWVEAALRTITGAIAFVDGDVARAADMHLAAAEIYGEIPNNSARILSVAWAVQALGRGGDDRIEPWRAELVAFAEQAGTPRLLELAFEPAFEPAEVRPPQAATGSQAAGRS